MLNNKHESIYWWIPIEKRGEKPEKQPEKQPENRYSWNPKVHMKEWEILSVLNFVKDPEFMERCSEHYPEMTTKEIKKILVDQQEDYTIYDIIHQHEWITEDVINKYVCRSKYFPEDLSDYVGDEPIKITVDTPEIHDCNLIKLTPELQRKTYWWHRWNRRTISHLINREDFVWEDGKQLENKTSKLTVVAKVDKGGYHDENEPYILIITAFWWDGKAKKEVRQDYYRDYEDADLEDMEYRLNHALIVENDEKIEKTWLEPDWLKIYNENKKQKEIKSIYERWTGLEYLALFREAWKEEIFDISDKSKEKIVQATENIPLKVEKDNSDGSRLIEFKLWKKIYKILDLNLENHTNDEYKHWDVDPITNIDKCAVKLWWMKWNDVDQRTNQELKRYVKQKQNEWLHIPDEKGIEELLQELWKEANLDNKHDQIAMFMYLTWMSWCYWLGMRNTQSYLLECEDIYHRFSYNHDGYGHVNLCMIEISG